MRGLMMIRILLVALFVMPAAAIAQTPDDIFANETLQEIRLFIHSQDLRELRERYTEDIYFPADFLWRGTRVSNVGVRVRGLATRSAVKPGLRIDFDRYVEGQAFFGLRSLVLDNVLKDPSLMRERTSMAFIGRMGQPAPRESFGRLYINDVYEGLYVFVEAVDADFLARTLGDGSGYLFEHKFAGGFYGEYLGDDYEPYKLRFAAQTHRLESDTMLYLPLRDLFYEVNQEVDGVWRDRVSRYIDLPQVVTHVAIETFLAEIDGFLGTAGMANFYLYRPDNVGLHRLLAWDRDTTFQAVDSAIFARVQDNALFRRALAFGDLRTLYLDTLAECARVAAADRWLETEIVRAHLLIRDAVYEDAAKPASNEEYERAIAGLVSFAQQRSGLVAEAVATAR